MPRLEWDKTGERFYETGVRHGVLYPMTSEGTYPQGVAWNGLTGVTESPSGAEANAQYADDIKYLNLTSSEEFAATIEAFTYPEEFAVCDGSAQLAAGVMLGQQPRQAFGFSYRTVLGNDVQSDNYGYKLHLIYNCKASPSEKGYQTINDSPEAITFSWECSSTPVNVTGHNPTSQLTIDSTKVDSAALSQIEDILYGTASSDARLPLPDEVIELLGGTSGTPDEGDDEDNTVPAEDNYVLTTDTEVDDTKTYYNRTGTVGNYVYTEVDEPSGNPSTQGWYELSDN